MLTALNSAMHEDRLLLNILLVILLIKLGLERWDPLTWSAPALLGLAAGLLLGHEWLRGAWIRPEFGLLGLAYALGGRLVATGQRPLSIMILGSTMAVQFTRYWTQYESSHGLLIATALLLFTLMTGFRVYNLGMASWLKNPLLTCSRYSLEIYFFHLTALKLYHLVQAG